MELVQQVANEFEPERFGNSRRCPHGAHYQHVGAWRIGNYLPVFRKNLVESFGPRSGDVFGITLSS